MPTSSALKPTGEGGDTSEIGKLTLAGAGLHITGGQAAIHAGSPDLKSRARPRGVAGGIWPVA
ncbi:MAG: hypothetical protein V1737_03810 [Chloroflexota bacterium]